MRFLQVICAVRDGQVLPLRALLAAALVCCLWATASVADPQGNRCDLATNVAALQTIRLLDAGDDDQSGLRYYTTDGTVLLGAWGEDSALAGTGNPYLDMGYAIPAFPTVISKKFATLLNDVNENGYPDAGDTLEYLVDVVNVGFATASHVIFEDNPPTNLTTYVTNSAMLAAGGATNDVPDSLPPGSLRDLLTVFLDPTNGKGGILGVVNSTGGSSTIANPSTAVTVTEFPELPGGAGS